jgi:membrane protein YdbS with pleckstrin-like domain
MLILINNLLAPGWAEFVVPIICFAGVFINGVFFLTNTKKQRQNLMPMIWAIAIALIAIIAALAGWPEMNWPIIALGSTGFALLVAAVIVLGKGIITEFVKRFSIK